MGDIYVRQRRNADAAIIYQEGLHAAPERGDFYRKLAIAYADDGHYSEAIEALQQALKRSDDAAIHYNLGVVYERQARYDEASRAFARTTEIDTAYGDAYFRLGQIQGKQGLFEEAAANFARMINLHPDYAPPYTGLGQVRHAAGSLRRSRAPL